MPPPLSPTAPQKLHKWLWKRIRKQTPSGRFTTAFLREARERLDAWPEDTGPVLIFTHGSPRTGNPVIARNLVRHHARRQPVLSFSFEAGPVDADFRETATLHTVLPEALHGGGPALQDLLHGLNKLRPPTHAVVNSAASWRVLKALDGEQIPTLLLIHELLRQTPEAVGMPAWAFAGAFPVFASADLLQDARAAYPGWVGRRHAVLSPGQGLPSQDFKLESAPAWDHYASTLDTLAAQLREAAQAEQQQAARLASLDALDPSFLEWPDGSNRDPRRVRRYLRSWASGVHSRKPFPGFHPGWYAEAHPGLTGDPLLHWIDSGRPAGPWMLPLLPPDPQPPPAPVPAGLRCALHVHAFYPELLPELLQALAVNRCRPDLWITHPPSVAEETIRRAMQAYAGRVECVPVPNRGRDLGPMVTGLGASWAEGYDVVGHVHTKMTAWHPDRARITHWRRFLIEHTLGGLTPVMDRVLAAFASTPELGLVIPATSSTGHWDGTREDSRRLARRMGFDLPPTDWPEFPMGSFFWARSTALNPWLALDLGWEDYPAEPIPNSGTLLQALERLPLFVCEARGHRHVQTHVPGVSW